MKLNKIIHEPIRLRIMSIILTCESIDFIRLKSELKLTDGNLSSHLKKLEEKKYIIIKKTYQDKKPNTKVSISKIGKDAFLKHIEFLENIVNQTK